MKNLAVYGIKNCDTMKKAFAWLDRHKIQYVFHDYKKEGVEAAMLQRALKKNGWEKVLNRKGTTWRALPEKTRNMMDDALALKTALDNPSIIRRPLFVAGTDMLFGWEESSLETFISKNR